MRPVTPKVWYRPEAGMPAGVKACLQQNLKCEAFTGLRIGIQYYTGRSPETNVFRERAASIHGALVTESI